MKKIIILYYLITLNEIKGQVVFCPPGAEWHYLFNGPMFSLDLSINEQIKYVGDSIDGPDTLKILKHRYATMDCGPTVQKTWIKQKGDTIFFNNARTKGTWQILYNFAALPGQTWQTILWSYNTLPSKIFTFTVQAVSSVTINGFNLKRMTVIPSGYAGMEITERYGSNAFLFN